MAGQRRALEQIVNQFAQIQRQIGELVRCFGFLRSQMNVHIILCIHPSTAVFQVGGHLCPERCVELTAVGKTRALDETVR